VEDFPAEEEQSGGVPLAASSPDMNVDDNTCGFDGDTNGGRANADDDNCSVSSERGRKARATSTMGGVGGDECEEGAGVQGR